jgi:large subunit ribosomal protein L35
MAIKIVKTKLKTKKAAAKRIKITGTGKALRKQAGRRHLNAHMSAKRKRSLRRTVQVSDAHMKVIRRSLPYAF